MKKAENLNKAIKEMSDQELREFVISKLKGKELFSESKALARKILQNMKVPEGLIPPPPSATRSAS